ncbi:metal transporter [Candidatus Bathyarchaeota archaeon RBG_13_38_9]|nr:MAG: metal transporter [Candidatus Bathyarchaeota archaeon RBG_13_38_9]
MHIPDGFLDITTATVTYIIFIVFGYYALRKIRGMMESEMISFVSILAAGIFAVQMLNWPLPGGTSLHFVGGALAGILLGPWLGFLTICSVVLVQAFIFHDGGITTLGANALNMAIIAVLIGHFSYEFLIRNFGNRDSIRFLGAFLGGWLGIVIAGAAVAIQIGYSQSFPYGIAITIPVMVGWHAVLGIIEGIITGLTIIYLSRRAPQLLSIRGDVK